MTELPKLHLTVGLPRSGKSTWAQSTVWPIVCPDSIRLALHGQHYVQSAEPVVWAIAKVMVASLFEAGHKDVILDATNNTRKRRQEWDSKDWENVYHVFDADAATCKQRAHNDHRADLCAVIERMDAQHEPLQLGEFK